jgi:hypothetical protein
MRERLKRALVESLVGAILVGWLFADGLARIVSACMSPLLVWATRLEYRSVLPRAPLSGLFARGAIQLLTAFLILLIAWLLLRWLYYILPVPNADHPDPRP